MVFHPFNIDQHFPNILVQKLNKVWNFFQANLILLGHNYLGECQVALPVNPDQFNQILDALVFDLESWSEDVSVKTFVEKHIYLVYKKHHQSRL